MEKEIEVLQAEARYFEKWAKIWKNRVHKRKEAIDTIAKQKRVLAQERDTYKKALENIQTEAMFGRCFASDNVMGRQKSLKEIEHLSQEALNAMKEK